MTQLDLFGAVLAAERDRDRAQQRRQRDALVCLRDAMPDALEVVVHLQHWRPQDTRAPRANGDWAYCVCRAGVRFENRDEWGHAARLRGERSGWDRTPVDLITWDELTDLVGHDQRRAQITAWVDSLPEPRWRALGRPHELWPDPGGWHIGYFCHDHVDAGWPARRHAWQLVLDLLNDAITALDA